MPTAPDVNDPEYWHHRAKEARRSAERMIDETAKQTMLGVAADCDRFAVRAAMRSIDELVVRRFIAFLGIVGFRNAISSEHWRRERLYAR